MFGNSPRIKILDFLIENDRISWMLYEIKSAARINHNTLKREMDKLIELDIVKNVSKDKRYKRYKMNKSNAFVKKLYEIYNSCNQYFFKKEMEKQNGKK